MRFIGKIILFFLFISIFTVSLAAVKIEFNDGTTAVFNKISFKDNYFTAGDSEFTRQDIRNIIFKTKTSGELLTDTEISADSEVLLIKKKSKEFLKSYKDFPGLIILDDGEFVLKPDGTRKYTYHFQGLIIKDSAKGMGSVQLAFDETQEKIDIIQARTIQPDGNIIYLDRNRIKIVKPQQKSDYFGGWKRLIFNLPEIQTGSVVEYTYEIDEYNPFDTNLYSGGWVFQSGYPVITSTIDVTLPSDKKLTYIYDNYQNFKYDTNMVFTSSSNKYSWKMTDLRPLIKEPNMPPASDIMPHLSFTIHKDWLYIFNFYGKLQKRRMHVTPYIKEKVKEIIKGSKTDEEKISKIYHYLQEKILYVSIKGSIGSGMSGHPAEDTLKNKYGDCVDKSILFSTMLNVIGIKSYPIIVKTTDMSLRGYTIPTLGGNHAINEILLNGKKFFLDSTSTTHRYPSFRSDDHGCGYVNAILKEVGKIPVPLPENNEKKYMYNIKLKTDNSISVRFRTAYNGSYESGVRRFWKYNRQSDHPILIRQWIKSIHPGAELDTFTLVNLYDISKPLSHDIKYHIKNYTINAGNLILFKPLGIKTTFNEVNLSTENRKFDLVYATSIKKVNILNIDFPENYAVEFIPENIKIENKHGFYERKINIRNNKIFYNDVFVRKSKVIPVSDYKEYKEFLNKIEEITNEQIIFSE